MYLNMKEVKFKVDQNVKQNKALEICIIFSTDLYFSVDIPISLLEEINRYIELHKNN